MDTWLILYFLKKRGFAFRRARPTKSFSLEDIFNILANELKVYQPQFLEDKITLSDNVVKSVEKLSFEDYINLSDNVINALLKILLEDETKLSGNVISTLSKIQLEDSFDLSGNLINVYSPMNLEDEMHLFSGCVKAYVSEALLNVEDEFTISDGLYKAFENILEINAEDSFNISDALIDMRLHLTLEDSFNISDSLTKSAKIIDLEDAFNINDALAKSVKAVDLEDSFNLGDSLAVGSKKETMEDTFNISDTLRKRDFIADYYFTNYNKIPYKDNEIVIGFLMLEHSDKTCTMVIKIHNTVNKDWCYYLEYTKANIVCGYRLDQYCDSNKICERDYLDETTFYGAVCSGYDCAVLEYYKRNSIDLIPKAEEGTFYDYCGKERPYWTNFNRILLYKNDGSFEELELKPHKFTWNYISKIAVRV